jgi:hypothetical protein
LQIPQIARKTVDAVDDHLVPIPNERDHLTQCCTGSVLATDLFLEDPFDVPEILPVQVLIDGADAPISDFHETPPVLSH